MSKFIYRFISSGQIAKNTSIATVWMALRVALQAAWLVFMAHAFGPQEYGLLAGTSALATTVGALTGMGFGTLLLQDASRNNEAFPGAWKRAIIMSIITGSILLAGYLAITPHIIKAQIGAGFYFAIGTTELLCFPIIGIASYAFQAHDRMGWAGLLSLTIPLGNLLAFVLYKWWTPTASLATYLFFHAAAAIASALASVAIVQCMLSPVHARFVINARDIQEGSRFSIMRLADTALSTLDKALVLRLSGEHSAGVYSAAYRLISVAMLPLIALSMSALPRLFRAGANDGASPSLIRWLVTAVLVYGTLSGIFIWFAAGLLPVLLGDGFRLTVEVTRWLALSPLLQGLYIIGANLLITQKMAGLRVFSQLIILGVMIASAVVLMPMFGLAGAAGMLLTTQAFAAIMIWLCYALGRWRQALAISRRH